LAADERESEREREGRKGRKFAKKRERWCNHHVRWLGV
jgi:hypothetical protein